jgi:1,4-dihydroxy-2-naphthoate octaprenyltransferase/chlorophyll synthase
LSLSSAIASGLSDEESDRAGGKTTLATLAGNAVARRAAELSATSGAAWWLIAAVWAPDVMPAWVVAPPVAVVLLRLRGVVRQSPLATTNRFEALRTYKGKLHRAIWDGTLILSFLLAAEAITTPRHAAADPDPVPSGALTQR